MNQSIVITGMGAVTPIGIGVKAYWQALLDGACGITDIPDWQERQLAVSRAAEVKNFHASDYLPRRMVMDLEPFMQYAYVSAAEAVTESGLDTHSTRVGVVMGTALSGITMIGDTNMQFADTPQVSPKFLTKAMGNLAASQFAINYGIQGPSMTVTTACSSGGDAISLAAMLLESGRADAIVVMAGEAALCPAVSDSLVRTGALSKNGQSVPFDQSRDGFVIGEGGGALVLETAAHAASRGAVPIAALLGCGNNTDAYHPVSPNPEGTQAALCMQLALADAGLAPADIDYINAHGTSTLKGDIAETHAIHQVFGSRPVFVSSTKGATGHMMGAGGITEVIACIKAVTTGQMAPNTGCTQQDADCDLTLVTKETGRQNIRAALSNAMGFGGQNSCIIVGRCPA